MAEIIHIPENAEKAVKYKILKEQLLLILEGENDLVANMANIVAAIKEVFGFFWVGFYLRKGAELVLGPFQGPVACIRIQVEPIPRGVCGTSAAKNKTILVPDVEKFPGHIACSSLSKSEIVVPLVINNRTVLVLDVDSKELNAFDDQDKAGLESIVEILLEVYQTN